MTRLTLISLDDTVVFPGMPVTLALDAGSDKYIFLMPRRGNMYAKVGVVAEVTERVQLPGRGLLCLSWVFIEEYPVRPRRTRMGALK